MHSRRRCARVLVMVLSLLFMAAVGSATAFAAVGGDGRVTLDSGNSAGSGGNQLTVVIKNDKDPNFAEDLANANVVVDIYKIATGDTSTDTYTLIAPYTGLESKFKAALAGEGDWEALAKEAARIPSLTANGTQKLVKQGKGASGVITGLDDGIYLILPHGKGITTGLVANTTDYKYSFSPGLLGLPSKDPATYELKNEVETTIKPQREKVSKPTTTPTPPVKTGDDLQLFPFYYIMAISGTLFVVLAIMGARERRKNRK